MKIAEALVDLDILSRPTLVPSKSVFERTVCKVGLSDPLKIGVVGGEPKTNPSSCSDRIWPEYDLRYQFGQRRDKSDFGSIASETTGANQSRRSKGGMQRPIVGLSGDSTIAVASDQPEWHSDIAILKSYDLTNI